MTFAPPSYNPADQDTLTGALNIVLDNFSKGLNDMLPAQIIAYNRTTNLAEVQPLISVVTTDNAVVKRAQILSVPVLQMGGGGFVLNFPIKAGDLGFIKANDRDISIFKQLWQMVVPNTARKHNFADGIFIPACLTNFTIESQDATNVVLQSINASVRFSMGNGNTCISDETSYSQSANAILDLQSTTRAFKFPAMTTGQKNAIASPQAGFAVFDTTEGGISVYNGSTWS